MKIQWRPLIAVGVLSVFAASRWPGLLPLNFSLVYGFVLCAAAFRNLIPGWALLATLLTTDVVVNVFYYDTNPFSDYMAVNYLAYGLIYALGRTFSRASSIARFVCGGLLAAVVFYLLTNTAAWAQNPEYAKTLSGWVQALTVGTAGWPETWKFFRNTLLSGGLFAGLLAAGLRMAAPEPVEEKDEDEAADAADAAEDAAEEAKV